MNLGQWKWRMESSLMVCLRNCYTQIGGKGNLPLIVIYNQTDNRAPVNYYTSLPPIPEPNPHRRLDASRLREIRKRLDSGHASAKEVEGIASECLEECVELCSGILGTFSSFSIASLKPCL